MAKSKVFSLNYSELLPLGNSSFWPVDPPTQRVIWGIGINTDLLPYPSHTKIRLQTLPFYKITKSALKF